MMFSLLMEAPRVSCGCRACQRESHHFDGSCPLDVRPADGSGHTCFVRVQSGDRKIHGDTYSTGYSTGYPVYCRYSQHSLRFGVFDYTGTAGYPVLYCTVLYSCTVLCTVPGTRYSLLPFKVADFSYYPVPEF